MERTIKSTKTGIAHACTALSYSNTYSDSYQFISIRLDSLLFLDAVPLDDSSFTASQYGLLD